MEIKKLLRPHLLNLTPYSSARDDFKGTADVYLDANENAYGSTSLDKYRRYPDPYQFALKTKIGLIKQINLKNIFLGNGSDEPIDLLIRAFCTPGKDKIIITHPTYGMYEVSANINNVEITRVPLNANFTLPVANVMEAISPETKFIFLCSPNNPTGNSIEKKDILKILANFHGLVILDEAYIDFSSQVSLIQELEKYPNLIILQTFSKAWGLASLRLGMTFANPEIIEILNMIKPPYNINGATQDLALGALENINKMKEMVDEILIQKKYLESMLKDISSVNKIYPSDANFILVKVADAHEKYLELITNNVIVRDRSQVALCEDCLRITIGTHEENKKLIEQLEKIS
jgi:histidinol-phosphate aminotransferase